MLLWYSCSGTIVIEDQSQNCAIQTKLYPSFHADFMQAAGAQAELFFWLTVEGYRVTAQQQLEAMQSWQKDGKKQPGATKGLLKAAALGVYEQYLSDKVGSTCIFHACFRHVKHFLLASSKK